MNAKTAILGIMLVLAFGIFLAGCTSSQSGYATYNQPQQQQYVGGGCGVAPDSPYESTPIEALSSAGSAL